MSALTELVDNLNGTCPACNAIVIGRGGHKPHCRIMQAVADEPAYRRRMKQADKLAGAAEDVAKLEIADVSPAIQALAAALAAYRETEQA